LCLRKARGPTVSDFSVIAYRWRVLGLSLELFEDPVQFGYASLNNYTLSTVAAISVLYLR
jgi:hypothetical protein